MRWEGDSTASATAASFSFTFSGCEIENWNSLEESSGRRTDEHTGKQNGLHVFGGHDVLLAGQSPGCPRGTAGLIHATKIEED